MQLTADRREMIRQLATSGAGIDVGVGPAGSGKTAAIRVLAQIAVFTGAPILGTALAARTAVGLQEDAGSPGRRRTGGAALAETSSDR